MDPRTAALWALGAASILVGLAFLLWPTPVLALGDRIPVGLLFIVPGVIGLDEARRR